MGGATERQWLVVERPGYLGKKKDEFIAFLNHEYGEGHWRFAWELATGEVMNYLQIFWQVYVPGYVAHFLRHPDEAQTVTSTWAYAYDKDLVTREQAFDPLALYDQPGRPNQFHNVAMNIALEWYLGLPFRGRLPLQVREGKPGTPIEDQPIGYLWSPGRIPAVRQDLIKTPVPGWWQPDSIEAVYQSTKVVQAW